MIQMNVSCLLSIRTEFQVSRWFTMVFMRKKLLHRRIGVLARVYEHFSAVSVVYTKQVSLAPLHAGELVHLDSSGLPGVSS